MKSKGGGREMTNADRLNAMSVEEKAKWIAHIAGCPLNVFEESPLGKCSMSCKARDCWLNWLKQEVKGK